MPPFVLGICARPRLRLRLSLRLRFRLRNLELLFHNNNFSDKSYLNSRRTEWPRAATIVGALHVSWAFRVHRAS